MNPISKIVADLNRFMPEQLFGYATAINQLAEEKLAGRLLVTPRVIGTSGEPQTPAISDNVVAAFGVRPKNMYISTETLLIGFSQSPDTGFTIYDDLNWCELLDDNNTPVRLNQLGHVTITNLFNLTTPLIRYKTNDCSICTEVTAPDQFFHIGRLLGRSYASVPILTNCGKLDKIHPIVLVEFFVHGVKHIQFQSYGPNDLRILYIADSDLNDHIRQKFMALLQEKQAENSTQLSVSRVLSIPIEPNGKTPLIKFANP